MQALPSVARHTAAARLDPNERLLNFRILIPIEVRGNRRLCFGIP